MVTDNVNDFLIEQLLFLLLLLDQPVGFLKSIEHLVVEVDLLPELREVLLPDLLVNIVMNLGLQLHDLDVVLEGIDLAIVVQIILSRVIRSVIHC